MRAMIAWLPTASFCVTLRLDPLHRYSSDGMNRPKDTSLDAYRHQIAALRAIGPAERLRMADAMSSDVRALAEAGIRHRRPTASAEEVADELAMLVLGAELAAAARRARIPTPR
jgi:hypothetical protein